MKELTKRLSNNFLQDFYPNGWQTRMFDEFFNRSKGGQYDWSPPTDITETESEYVIEMEIPGMEEDDIKVSLNENHLTIVGEIKKQEESIEIIILLSQLIKFLKIILNFLKSLKQKY